MAAKRALDGEWREDTATSGERKEADRSETRLRTREEGRAPGVDEQTEHSDEEEIDLDDGETPFETFDADLYEMTQVVTPPRRGARVPPPPKREEIDLDALVRDAGGSSMPLLSVDLSSIPRAPEPQSRPRWGIAIMIATTAIVASTVSALTMFVLSGSPSSEPPSPPPAPVEHSGARALVAATVETPARANEGSPAARAETPSVRAEAPLAPAQPAARAPWPVQAQSPAPRRPASSAGSERRRAAPPVRSSPAPASGAESQLAQIAPGATAASAEEAEVSAAEASAPPRAALPEQPSRAEVDAAVRAILPALRSCGDRMDLVTLELHFASNGQATTGQVEARHLSPAQRSCIARAARAARVPPFTASHLSVRYPVRL